MIQVLDLADKDLKITVTNMLNKIKEKMDNIDEMLENSTIEFPGQLKSLFFQFYSINISFVEYIGTLVDRRLSWD